MRKWVWQLPRRRRSIGYTAADGVVVAAAAASRVSPAAWRGVTDRGATLFDDWNKEAPAVPRADAFVAGGLESARPCGLAARAPWRKQVRASREDGEELEVPTVRGLCRLACLWTVVDAGRRQGLFPPARGRIRLILAMRAPRSLLKRSFDPR